MSDWNPTRTDPIPDAPNLGTKYGGLLSIFDGLRRDSLQVASCLLEILDSSGSGTDTQEQCRKTIEKYIEFAYEMENPSDRRFVSGIILADLEEVLNADAAKLAHKQNDFFGPVLTVHPGYGGKHGLSVIDFNEQIDSNSNGMQKILQYMEENDNGVPKEALHCLGMEREWSCTHERFILFIPETGRIVNLVDIEHMCCKIHLFLS